MKTLDPVQVIKDGTRKALVELIDTDYMNWDLFDDTGKKIGTVQGYCKEHNLAPDELLKSHKVYQAIREYEKSS